MNLEGFRSLSYLQEDDNSAILDIRIKDNVTFFYDKLIKGQLVFVIKMMNYI